MNQEQYQEDTLEQTNEASLHQLILHNDDVNTFDFVIDTLIEVCDHDPIQAEQCAIMVHFRGQCEVKSGSYAELLKPYTIMQSRELTVSID